ncbi:MAG: amidohydrolase family protein [bacterium]|nr:amidohydrolase family protein [bacterium]
MSMIDMHAHYLSPSVLREASAGSVPVGLAPDGRSLLFPSGPSRPVPPPLSELTDRLRWMEERAIERQILAPWMDVTGDDLAPEEATVWCRAMNDSCAEDIGDEPRFGALAALPVVDGEAAARELVRSVEQLGFAGGAIPTQVGGRDLDVAGLEPLWEAAASLGALLFIHPFRVMGGDRLKAHFLGNVCGNPFETTLAALRLYFAGTFARWPDLRVLLSHGGGVLPVLAGRAAHASRHAPGFDRAVDHPDSILECFYYDTILHDARALTLLMNTVESARIAAGTDYPFPMILDRPTDHAREAADQAGLTEDELHRILSGTAEELLGRMG